MIKNATWPCFIPWLQWAFDKGHVDKDLKQRYIQPSGDKWFRKDTKQTYDYNWC